MEDEFNDELCHFCGGDGFIYLDMETIDDPINMCDWSTGGELGETVKCKCCGGSGLSKDCIFF